MTEQMKHGPSLVSNDEESFDNITISIKEGFYKYKGKHYIALGIVKMKDPNSRGWFLAAKYEREDIPRVTYVREINDFNEKFKPVKLKPENTGRKIADIGKKVDTSSYQPLGPCDQ